MFPPAACCVKEGVTNGKKLGIFQKCQFAKTQFSFQKDENRYHILFLYNVSVVMSQKH